MKGKFSLLTLLFFSIKVYSQEINFNASDKRLNITSKLKIQKLVGAKYENINNKFKNVISLGNTGNTILKLECEIVNLQEKKCIFEIDNSFIKSVKYIIKHNNQVEIIHSGFEIPIGRKVIYDKTQSIALSPGKNIIEIYLQPLVHPFAINIYSQDSFSANKQKTDSLISVILGILCFISILSMIAFILTRNIDFLFYFILVLAYIISIICVLEGVGSYFIDKLNLMWFYRVVPLVNSAALLIYVNSFLKIKRISSRIHNLSYFILMLISIYLFVLNENENSDIYTLNYFLVILCFIYTVYLSFISYKLGSSRNGFYFLLSYIFWLIFLLFELSYIHFGYPGHILGITYITLFMLIECVFLAILLILNVQTEKEYLENEKFELNNKIIFQEKSFLENQLKYSETEKNRIAQDLHDGLGSLLVSLKYNIEAINNFPKVKLMPILIQAIEEVKRVAYELKPVTLERKGLEKSLKELFLNSAISKYKEISIDISLNISLTNDLQIIIFRITQELLNNTIKYSKANAIIFSLKYFQDKNVIELIFEDNGIGFEEAKIVNPGLGLESIKKRIEYYSGELFINSKPKLGTKILINFFYKT